MSTNISPIKLKPTEKVVAIVSLLSGIVPPWAQDKNDLTKLVCALTGMEEKETTQAIQDATKQGLIKYYGPESYL